MNNPQKEVRMGERVLAEALASMTASRQALTR
jgi:hypothetical protein